MRDASNKAQSNSIMVIENLCTVYGDAFEKEVCNMFLRCVNFILSFIREWREVKIILVAKVIIGYFNGFFFLKFKISLETIAHGEIEIFIY